MPKGNKTLIKIISAAIFIFLEIAALSMLSRNGELQGLWLGRISHTFMAKVWGGSQSLKNYFSLKDENEKLAKENLELYEKLKRFTDAEMLARQDSISRAMNIYSGFHFTSATIVKISRNKQHNYLILDKGSEDGIRPQSGIITTNGVVGIIDAVDKHYSYALSFMNPSVSVSARIGRDGRIGPLVWDGMSSHGAILKEIPLQEKYSPGDTIWTSGFSAIFPPDIPLGITGDSYVVNGTVNEIKVNLFEDFSSVRYVTIVENEGRDEIIALENLENEQNE